MAILMNICTLRPLSVIAGIVGSVALAISADAADSIEGRFALAGSAPGVAGVLVVSPQGSALDVKLDVMLHRPAEKNALKRYETIDGNQMRILVLSDDLGQFFDRPVPHVIDGHGQAWVRFPGPGRYHIYVDAVPHTLTRQVVRFDVTLNPAVGTESRELPGPVTKAETGPYTLRFDTLDLTAQHASTLKLHIAENDKPAKDLRPCHGRPAHATMISAADLSFIPIETAADKQPASPTIDPDISFATNLPAPGAYRLFVEFDGGRLSYTSPFVAIAK
jgi:hypothetical protein